MAGERQGVRAWPAALGQLVSRAVSGPGHERGDDDVSVRAAMSALRGASLREVVEALDRVATSPGPVSDLDLALRTLEHWYGEMPPRPTSGPPMSFAEFVLLLHQAYGEVEGPTPS